MSRSSEFAALGWVLAGVVVSLSIIQTERLSLFGWPLLALSILLGLMALWRALRAHMRLK